MNKPNYHYIIKLLMYITPTSSRNKNFNKEVCVPKN